jgi:hypothetical protein
MLDAAYQARLVSACNEGRRAKVEGKPITASPFTGGTPMGEEWESGWWEGGFEDSQPEAPEKVKPAVEPGPKPELLWVPLEKLAVDHRYQRELGATNRAHINRIAREFRWGFCQPLCVARVDGDRFTIIDGQHRFEAAKRHPSIDTLPCWIVDADSIEDQAKAFKALNSARIGVSPLHRFWASLAAGEPMATRIKALCDKANVQISKSKTKELPPMVLACVTSLERATLYGDVAILAALLLIGEAQGGVGDAFRPATVGALTKVIHDDGQQFDRPVWLKTLKAIDLEATEQAARADRAKGGGPIEAAMEKRLRRAFERTSARKAA